MSLIMLSFNVIIYVGDNKFTVILNHFSSLSYNVKFSFSQNLSMVNHGHRGTEL